MTSGIYCIERIETGKKYIGKGVNVERRMKEPHKNSSYLYNAIKKYGNLAFIYYIIEYCESDKLNEREQYYIKEWNTRAPNGYNLTNGGDGTLGYSPSPETIEKLSISHRGKHQSPEAIEKKRKATAGIPRSIKAIENQSKGQTGLKKPGATSSFQGVCKKKSGGWRAQITLNKKMNYIGTFKLEIDAAKAYDKYIIGNNLPNPLNFPEDYK